MNDVIRGTWVNACFNGDFICVETNSGYRGGMHVDPKGAQHLLTPDASDESLGVAVLDALARSRWVLGAPRDGSTYAPDVEFDSDLYDYKQTAERYASWIKALMERYGYKTKRALFKHMMYCYIE